MACPLHVCSTHEAHALACTVPATLRSRSLFLEIVRLELSATSLGVILETSVGHHHLEGHVFSQDHLRGRFVISDVLSDLVPRRENVSAGKLYRFDTALHTSLT